MKVLLSVINLVFFFCPQLLVGFDRPDNIKRFDSDNLESCSTVYLNLEHKVNQAYDLLIESDISNSISLYEEIESALENAEIPIREKLTIANRVSLGYYELYEIERGLAFAEKYANLATQSLAWDEYQLGKSYEFLAAFQLSDGDLESSIVTLTHAQNILDLYSDEFLIYFHLGEYYQESDQFQESIEPFKLAIDNFNHEDKSIETLRRHFFVYGSYYYTLIFFQDFTKTLKCIKKMEELSDQLKDPFLNFIVDLYYAYYFISLDELDKAWEHLDQELPDHPNTFIYFADYYEFRGMVFHMQGKYEKAIEMFQVSLDDELSYGFDTERLRTIYFDMGLTYVENNEPEKALNSFNNALCSFDNLVGGHSEVLEEIAWLYYSEEKYDLSKSYFLQAFNLEHENTVNKITTVEGIISVYLESFANDNDINHLDSILFYMDIQDNLLVQLRKEHRYFSDQSSVELNTYESYTFNLEILVELLGLCDSCNYILDRLFMYVEGVKAYSFRKEIREQEGLHAFGVPDELIERINHEKKLVKDLQDDIYKFEQKLSKPDTEFSDKEIIKNKKQQLDLFIENYNSTMLNVEMNYPSYFNYKFNNSSVTIKDIQNILEPQQAFIEYFTSDTSIYIISIEHDTVHYFNKSKPKEWLEILEGYSYSVTNRDYQHQDSTSITYQKFTDSSYDLYRILIKDVLDLIDDQVTHLTIVPDDQLHFIQFDNLLTQESESHVNYKGLDYLILDFTISRSESAFIYSTLKNKDRQHKKYKYVGFAPKYISHNTAIVDSLESDRKQRAEFLHDFVARGSYDDLPSARNSVNLISSIFGGISFTGGDATRHAFLKRSREGNIVHFAGHAIVDKQPKFSQLLFSHVSIDSQLYASDIYDMGLDIDLAVLSACNTGNGKSKLGEGVMSLSRAFKFAGCSSLVMSLWNIPDVQTAEIDYHFFENIQKGERIDDALRNSKLKFLSESTYQTAHPFYWSALTSSGNMNPIKTQNLWDRLLNMFM